jgi:hypothetical protein
MTRTRETATQLDDAIDSIIRGGRAPAAFEDGELTATARVLHRSLPRLHPSFGFEDLLAARLAAARRMDLAPLAAMPARPQPTPIRTDVGAAPSPDEHDPAGSDRRRRNLVAGGAIASGVSLALPIAGAAIVVWRRTRSSGGIL